MTQQPYTDADLRAEAARQLGALTEDPEFMGVGEQMNGADISSRGPEEDEEGRIDPDAGAWKWDELLDEDQFNAAQRKIHNLITGAADVSQWAIQLGAAGLTPHPAMGWYCTTSGWDTAVQIATHPDLRPDLAAEIQTAVRAAVDNVMASTGCTVTHAEEPTP
ncbi:hypothetical protein [Streptomyces sp. NBC_01238]|uniref:hypothetical protein n=1 Tax=Streptomyces sp. NBC_01238 TaxID=2903791 RepID=UPI002F908975